MNYIESNLQPGEEIKYVAKLHFFLFLQPIILLLIGALLASSPKEVSAMTHYAGLLILFFGLAKQIDKSFSMVNAYACNRIQPNLETLQRIAEVLHVDLKDLITDKEDR